MSSSRSVCRWLRLVVMGKGDTRRPLDETKVGKRWPMVDKFEVARKEKEANEKKKRSK